MMSVNPNIQTFHIKRILIHKSMQTRCCIFKSIHTECVHTQVCILRTFFSCWWMGTHASARRSAHSRPLLWSSHSAARLHYYGTGFEEWRPPNERTHLHVWVPGCVANWFLGFLESREMSAQIIHSYLVGQNWFWQWDRQKNVFTPFGLRPYLWQVIPHAARSTKTLLQTE